MVALRGELITGVRKYRPDLGLIVVAIKKASGEMVYTPPAETVLEAEDTLIALGRRDQLDLLEKMAAGKGRA